MIRPARPDDIPQIIELCRAHAIYEKAQYREDNQAVRLADAIFGPHPQMYAWVVDENGSLQGYMTAVLEFATWPARQFVYMDTLFLDETARRHGLGRQLMATLSAFAQSQGIHEIQWQTPPWNEDGIAFYTRIGSTGAEKIRFTLRLD